MRLRLPAAILLYASIALPVPTQAQRCRVIEFAGEVRAGEAFEHALGDGLVFRLAPASDPPGWTLEVQPEHAASSENERVWAATPPYRFWNPRYLDTSYGQSAEAALAMDRRDFAFIPDSADHRAVVAAVRTLLWPAGIPADSVAAARAVLDTAPRAEASLRILDGSVENGAIAWLRFDVTACIPARPRAAPTGPPAPGRGAALLID